MLVALLELDQPAPPPLSRWTREGKSCAVIAWGGVGIKSQMEYGPGMVREKARTGRK